MNATNSTERQELLPALSEHDAQRVLELLEATGEVHRDLWNVLTKPNTDQVVDEVFRDEIHAQDA
jgi:hypothetical protein